MKNKKLLLTLGTVATAAAPVATAVSCGTTPESSKPYTVGFALDPVTSLNYLKYKSSLPFAHSLVEGLAKPGPKSNSALKNYMTNLKKPFWRYSDGSSLDITKNYQIYSGTLRTAKKKSNNLTAFRSYGAKFVSSSVYDINLNGVSKWSNGDKLISSDFIDSIVYILDLNSGSQLSQDILDLGIYNAATFINAQTEYAKKFGVLYQNPFGYIENPDYKNGPTESKFIQRQDAFPLQQQNSQYVADEQNIVNKIEYAAKNLGIFGGSGSSHDFNTSADAQTKNKVLLDVRANEVPANKEENVMTMIDDGYGIGVNVKTYPYKIRIVTDLPKNQFNFIINSLARANILPVNRKFVEGIGGIEKFGLSSSLFLTQGPFNINKLILGDRGGARFVKNQNYWDSSNTIPDSVKIYFQSDKMVQSTLFEDGYISSTGLNALTAKKFYAQAKYRSMIEKSAGNGTTGLVFNLDPNSPDYNEALADTNLRKALFYAINREEIIKLSGYDATLPAYAMSDASASGLNYEWLAQSQGVSLGQAFNGEIFTSSHGEKIRLFPIDIQTFASSQILLGNVDKKEKAQNLDAARYYFNKFQENRKAQGKSPSVSIQYTHDSTKQLLNTGIAIQTQLKRAFGSELSLSLKGYPKSIYDTFYSSGKFQMTYRNMDYLAKTMAHSTQAFFIKDSISKAEQKSTGFITNPTGGWTFKNVVSAFDNGGTLHGETLAQFKDRIGISDEIWEVIKNLSIEPTNGTPEEKRTIMTQKVQAFFDSVSYTDSQGTIHPVDSDFDTNYEISKVVIILNKIIMDQSPVIPTFVVDIRMSIKRMAGYEILTGGFQYSFDYAYDLVRKPRADLPGLEALGG